MNITLVIFCVVLCVASIYLWKRQVMLRREEVIRTFQFPNGLYEKLKKHHPQLTLKECQLVSRGLRKFFLAYLKSGRKFVSMPSQVVDDFWHEFILYTKEYQSFCDQAFGGFFHHTPAAVLKGGQLQSNMGLRRCWRYACQEENINPRSPTRLPLLFALDTKLNIANGFHYVADCESIRRKSDRSTSHSVCYCGGDFSDSSIDGSTSGFDDGSGDSGGDSGGDGGGCGGGGD